jgi:hypothetical protein
MRQEAEIKGEIKGTNRGIASQSPQLQHMRPKEPGTLPRVTQKVQSQAQTSWQSLVPSVLPTLLHIVIYEIQTLED